MQLNLSHIHCSQGLWRLRVTYDPAFEGHALRALAEEPDRWMAGADSRLLKHDCTTTVSSVASGDNHWVVKRYNTKNAWHWLRRSFQRSRASIVCASASSRLAWSSGRSGSSTGRGLRLCLRA